MSEPEAEPSARTHHGHGVRSPWSALPAPVREWVAAELGAAVVDAVDQTGGFSPGPAARVGAANGRRAFVKAAGSALNPESPGFHRREAALTRALPRSPLTPELLGVYDDGDWVALLYTEVDGRSPELPWQPDELARARDALTRLHASFTPCPVPDADSVVERFAAELTGWRTLASGAVPAGLDAWSARHLDRLAELESHWEAAATGDTLLHSDVRADNLLLTADGVVFVDWAHACRGDRWFDLAAWAPSVTLQGGPDPETFLAAEIGKGGADRLTPIVAALAGYFTERAAGPPPPGLPTLREFQAAQGAIAREWLRARTGLR